MLEVIKLKEVISSLCETENKRLTARDLRKSLSETLGMSQTKIQDYMTIYKRLDKKSMEMLRSGELGISAALELARMKKKNTEDKNVSESDINKRESKPYIVEQEQDFSKFMSKPVDENVSDSDTEYGLEDVRTLFEKNRDASTKDEKIILDALTLLIEKFGGKCIEG